MTPENIKRELNISIENIKRNINLYVSNPGHDLTRNRKLPVEKVISTVLAMEGRTVNNELLYQNGCSLETASASALIQQRNKISSHAFDDLFHNFTKTVYSGKKRYKGYSLLAVDGSDIQIALNRNDPDSLLQTHENHKPYNLLHLDAMYDVLENVYVDSIIGKKGYANEKKSLTAMVDRSSLKQPVIILADRGYESYNVFAHIQEKNWKFLIRIKDLKKPGYGMIGGYDLPPEKEFDMDVDMNLTRRKIKERTTDKNHYRIIGKRKPFDFLSQTWERGSEKEMYNLKFRIVRFKLKDNSYEVIMTNLDKEEFPAEIVKHLYSLRWGIETSFRALKYTIGLLHLHSKKMELILQEIYARLTMYNFFMLITSHVVIKKKSDYYKYKLNFSIAAHICREFFLGKIPSSVLEALLSKHLIPIRPNRTMPRNMRGRHPVSFTYRIS